MLIFSTATFSKGFSFQKQERGCFPKQVEIEVKSWLGVAHGDMTSFDWKQIVLDSWILGILWFVSTVNWAEENFELLRQENFEFLWFHPIEG